MFKVGDIVSLRGENNPAYKVTQVDEDLQKIFIANCGLFPMTLFDPPDRRVICTDLGEFL